MSYIASGQFRSDMEKLVGNPIVRKDDADDDEDERATADEQLEGFTPELRGELTALRELAWKSSLPELCELTWGDYCSVPALTGDERDEVLDWFDGDEKATDFVMKAVDIINGGGGFYIVVSSDGKMGLVCEDPHSFDPLDCTLPQFLQALIAAHRALTTNGMDAAKAELGKVVDAGTSDLLLTFADRLAPKK